MSDKDDSGELEEVEAPVYAWKMMIVQPRHVDGTMIWHVRPTISTTSDDRFELLDWNETSEPGFNWSPGQIATNHGHPGFHSFNDRRKAVDYMKSGTTALAKVELGGVVVEHEEGYRSQKFRVHELYVPLVHVDERIALADAVGWPFEILYEGSLDLPSWAKYGSPSMPKPISRYAVDGQHPGIPRVTVKNEGIGSTLVHPGYKAVRATLDPTQAMEVLQKDPGWEFVFKGKEMSAESLSELHDEWLEVVRLYELELKLWESSWRFDPTAYPDY